MTLSRSALVLSHEIYINYFSVDEKNVDKKAVPVYIIAEWICIAIKFLKDFVQLNCIIVVFDKRRNSSGEVLQAGVRDS